MTFESINVALTLTADAIRFLDTEAATAGMGRDALISQFLNDLSDPAQDESILIDQLLVSASSYFPPIMTLEEKEEVREEVLDFLISRLSSMFKGHTGFDLSEAERDKLRDRFSKHAPTVWGP